MEMNNSNPPLLQGIDFTAEDAESAIKLNKLLLLDIDFTPECNLNCIYCDRTTDRNKTEELTFEERIFIIQQAAELGCRTVESPGAGEPMLDHYFWESIEFIHSKGMIPVIYTNGTLIDKKAAERLFNMNASIVLKYNSPSAKTQDILVGKKGFAAIADRALQTLIEAGLNKSEPTRLAIDMVVTPYNRHDITSLFRMCRESNIFPFASSLIPHGNALKKRSNLDKDLVIERDELAQLLDKIERIDQEEFHIKYKAIMPTLGGFVCRQINFGMFITFYGDVYDCNGMSTYYGNVRQQDLASIWNGDVASRTRRQVQNGYCPVREDYWSKNCSIGRSSLGIS